MAIEGERVTRGTGEPDNRMARQLEGAAYQEGRTAPEAALRAGNDSGRSSVAQRLASAIAALYGWRLVLAATATGAVSALAMTPVHASPVLFVTLPLLLLMIRADAFVALEPQSVGDEESLLRRLRRGFSAGWWFGFGYHLAGLYWIGGAFLVQADSYAWLMPLAVTLMPAGLALFLGAAGAITAAVPARWLDPAIAFVLVVAGAEALKGFSFTGFPWNSIGYALTWPLVLMQSASVLGLYGLTLIAVAIALLPAVVFARLYRSGAHQAAWAGVAAGLTPIGILAVFGAMRLSEPTAPDLPQARVRIVQPSIPQADKWDPEKQQAIFQDHMDLSREDSAQTGAGLGGVTHLIWPEASMPFGPLAAPAALAQIANLLPSGTQLIAGILRLGDKDASGPQGGNPDRALVFNSAAVFDDAGRAVAIYDKVHLVPFGEYLPFPELLNKIGLETVTRQRGGFASGPSPRRPMDISGLPPVEMLICYEVVFPQGIAVAKRPNLIINLTNDGWFGVTSGPFQHLHQARVRAVEFGVPLIRAANNGISAVIDGHGRVRSELQLNARGTLDSTVPQALEPTLYSSVREGIFLSMWTLLLLGGAGARIRFTRSRVVDKHARAGKH